MKSIDFEEIIQVHVCEARGATFRRSQIVFKFPSHGKYKHSEKDEFTC